jgi:NADH dehydrogenase/NADH:ubiquinone oxidoreductase subunit G
MTAHFYWDGEPVPFQPGETIAAALLGAGIVHLGHGRVFCGIGACQGCLVAMAGTAPVEACLTPAREGQRLSPLAQEQADHD